MEARVAGAALVGASALVIVACSAAPPMSPSSRPNAALAPGPTSGDDEGALALVGEEGEGAREPPAGAAPPPGSAGAALLVEADRELAAVKSGAYSHHTHVDETTGTFEYDCSGFLRYALSRAAPDALAAVEAAASRRPRAVEFVTFLRALPAGEARARWQRVLRVQDLAPGDVVAWVKPADSSSTNTGHTMVVHGAPSPFGGGAQARAFVVPVVDSAAGGHGPADARGGVRTGLGAGDIVLVVDDAGAPIAFRWSTRPRSSEKATTIALGRLR